ncbi:MAG: hypothetical protein ABIN67_07760 [Ferruginibacter sp.]
MMLKAILEGLAVRSKKVHRFSRINGESCRRQALYLDTIIAETCMGTKAIDFEIEDERTISCIPNYFMMMEHIQFEKQ